MVIPLLIAFALPATAAVIYVTFRPLWRNATGPSEIAGTYRAMTLQAILFVLVLQALALSRSWLVFSSSVSATCFPVPGPTC